LNPYISKIELTDEEVEGILETSFGDWGFENADAVILHGGPSKRDEKARFEVFEEIASYVDEDTELYFPEDSNYLLEGSSIGESKINYIDPEITEDDITMSGRHQGRIHVTSDYHADRVDRLLDEYDSEVEYIVLGAYTGDMDTVAEKEAAGVEIPVTHEVAEINELRRKAEGSRF